MSKINYFAIGSYTKYAGNAPYACGLGIEIISLNTENGELQKISKYTNIINPTYLCWSKINKKLFSIGENSNKTPKILSFSIDNNHRLIFIAENSGIDLPLCHIASLEQGSTIFAVSYDSGSINRYLIDPNENIKTTYNFSYKGKGSNPDRQESPHAHQVVPGPNEKFIYISDLGSDKVWIHNVESDKKNPVGFLELPPGYGPRHLTFNKNGTLVYILCELKPILLVAEVNTADGSLKIMEQYPTVCDPDISKSAPAAIKIHPSGRTLAVTNRVDNTVAIFKIHGQKLKLQYEFSTKGKHPREITFSPDGEWLLIANQDTSDINIRKFNSKTGEPEKDWGPALKIGSPVCIVNMD